MIRITPLTAALWVTSATQAAFAVYELQLILRPDYLPDRAYLACALVLAIVGAVATWIAGWRNFIRKLNQD